MLKDAAAPVAQDIIARRDDAVQEYMQQFPEATSGDIQEFATKWVRDNVPDLVKPAEYKDGALSGYTFRNQSSTAATTQDLISQAQSQAFVNAYTRREAVDYSSISAKGMTGLTVGQINTRDNKYLTTAERNDSIKAYATGGAYPASVTKKAYALGVTADQLVRDQAAFAGYQLGDRPQQSIDQATGAPAGDPTNLRTGYQALMAMGFPERGAAYLAGNIQQESGWNGQRTWGEVMGDGSDRNGGLVSWMDDAQRNHYRLRNIENYLGKPISQATAQEQLDAMVWEMRRRNPDSYRVFMNPNSTDAQLRRASYRYWGYGHEGARFTYANSLLR